MAPFRSIEPAPPLNAEDRVLWDVVEEHLDEAEFCFELFENQLDHPTLTLAELAKGVEARLFAHIDALVVGGPAVIDRLLTPQIVEASAEQSARVSAAALALVAAGRVDLVEPALFHEHHAIRSAAVRACTLLSSADMDRWALARLDQAKRERELQPLLEFAARRGLEPPNVLAALQSSDPHLSASAARAARFGDRRLYLAAVEYLIDHPEVSVRHAAAMTALAAGSRRAWAAFEAWALNETTPSPDIMPVYAALGGPPEHAALAQLLPRKTHRQHVLFALGFSGDPALMPVLIEYLHSEDLREAKLAAQAISTITGLDLQDDALRVQPRATPDVVSAEPGAHGSVPPLDEDLVHDLALVPEDALPQPNAFAILKSWQEISTRFRQGTRYIGGQPYSRETLLQYLKHAPMRRRHAFASSYAISSGADAWIDTRALSATQRARLADL